MDWLNDGVGLIVLISAVVIVLLLAVALALLFTVRNKIAVQRLKFLGFYSVNRKTRERYAECVIGNPSLNEVALTELGVRNGKVTFNLTDLYKKKAGIAVETRVVIEQRSSVRLTLNADELMTLLADGKKGKMLNTLRLYAVDLTGTLYKGKIKAVKKLISDLLSGVPVIVPPEEMPEEEDKKAPKKSPSDIKPNPDGKIDPVPEEPLRPEGRVNPDGSMTFPEGRVSPDGTLEFPEGSLKPNPDIDPTTPAHKEPLPSAPAPKVPITSDPHNPTPIS